MFTTVYTVERSTAGISSVFEEYPLPTLGSSANDAPDPDKLLDVVRATFYRSRMTNLI